MHIVGLAYGQTLCLKVYIHHAYVQGKSSTISRSYDMGTFMFSHTFLLYEEEQLVSLHPGLAATHIVATVMSILMALQTHYISPMVPISQC